MTDVPACLGGAALDPETHFSLLKINTSHAPPSWFSRGDTHPKSMHQRERATMLSAWAAGGGCHYFQQQLWQNCTSVSLSCPPSLPIREYLNHPWARLIRSPMLSLPTQVLERCYLEVFVKKWFIGDSVSKFLPVTAAGSLISGLNVNLVTCQSCSDCFKFSAFVLEIHSECRKGRASAAFCRHRLCSITVSPVTS